MIKIGIVGAAGYSGVELIKLLLNHPDAEIKKLFGQSTAGLRIDEVHTSLRNLISLQIENFSEESLNELDLIFVALPSGQAFEFVQAAYNKNVKVIDIGGDFRLKNIDDYKKYYKHEHKAQELLQKAVYGLSEWNELAISNAEIVSNPGCYPTSILLALLPLLKNDLIDDSFVSIVSYSGTSGAGKSAVQNMIFSEVNENVRAYKVGNHQHIPEIKYYLESFGNKSINFSFVPHLLPATRGIYTTINAQLKEDVDDKIIKEVYASSYSSKPFIRFIGNSIPEMKDVANTNFCDIGFVINDNSITIFSTIDNLIKGAAGQAVQNMNILFGLPQETGLLKWNKNWKLQLR
ncbi:MAG: N-acetyl-gamma-glutamyl-phosphate reductase [Melioribacteraceae bacterium]